MTMTTETDTNRFDAARGAVFFGVVHPQGGGWYFEDPIEIPFDDGHWTILLVASQFRVVVRSEVPNDLATFRNELLSIVQGCLDALGFCVGLRQRPARARRAIGG